MEGVHVSVRFKECRGIESVRGSRRQKAEDKVISYKRRENEAGRFREEPGSEPITSCVSERFKNEKGRQARRWESR
jgi:hypothetical protein